jgi:hypothetical protein
MPLIILLSIIGDNEDSQYSTAVYLPSNQCVSQDVPSLIQRMCETTQPTPSSCTAPEVLNELTACLDWIHS